MPRPKTRKRLTKLRARLLFAARFAAILSVSTFLVTSEAQRAAVAQALKNPMSVLSERSPGERQKGALRPAKVRHEVKLPKGEQLLSEGRVVNEKDLAGEPGFFAEHEPAPPTETTLPSGTGKTPTGDMPPIAHGGGAGGGRGYFGGVGGGTVGGGGGGGGNDDLGCIYGDKCSEGSTVPSGEPVPPTTIIGVPEPATWAMVLIGFFTLGAIIRRAKPARATRAASRPHPIN